MPAICTNSNYMADGWSRWDLEIIHLGKARQVIIHFTPEKFTPTCPTSQVHIDIQMFRYSDIHGVNTSLVRIERLTIA